MVTCTIVKLDQVICMFGQECKRAKWLFMSLPQISASILMKFIFKWVTFSWALDEALGRLVCGWWHEDTRTFPYSTMRWPLFRELHNTEPITWSEWYESWCLIQKHWTHLYQVPKVSWAFIRKYKLKLWLKFVICNVEPICVSDSWWNGFRLNEKWQTIPPATYGSEIQAFIKHIDGSRGRARRTPHPPPPQGSWFFHLTYKILEM